MDWDHTTDTEAGVLVCKPLAPGRFGDMEAVFGERGVARRCFCMHWRRPDGGFGDKRDNRDRFADIAAEGPPPGLIGYVDDEPVGWVQVGPRGDFPTSTAPGCSNPSTRPGPGASIASLSARACGGGASAKGFSQLPSNMRETVGPG